jgi:hypothetical protein
MIPGPDIILACPHCEALAKLPTFDAIDPTGALSWTDGYQELPGVPRQPNVVRCHRCEKLYWLAVAPQVGFLMPGEIGEGERAAWNGLPAVTSTDEAGYFEALKEGLAAFPEQELELRVFAWWRGNDKHRNCKNPGRFPKSAEAIANAERLIELTDAGDHELVLFKAEALRQLGRFKEASDTLYGLCSDYTLARERQKELIALGSRDLDVLFTEETLHRLAAEQEEAERDMDGGNENA